MKHKFIIFDHPYILVEDLSGVRKPFYKEYKGSLPTLNLFSQPLCCPFTNRKASTLKNRRSKVEFCEICYFKIDDYDQHILLPLHREYARDDSNYDLIDQVAAEYEVVDRPASPCMKYELRENYNFHELVHCESVFVLDENDFDGNNAAIEDILTNLNIA